MNKNIKSEIAIGIIFIIAVIIGGFIWLGNKQQEQNNVAIQPLVNQNSQKSVVGDIKEDTAIPDQTIKIINRNNGKIFSIDGMNISLPSNWIFVKELQGNVYIKDKNQKTKYNTFLVLDIRKNNPNHIKSYKDERGGLDYTPIRGGEIFKDACGGAVACNGAIINGDVYYFGWAVESDEPAPKNLSGIWEPTHNFTSDAIWNMLKSIVVAE